MENVGDVAVDVRGQEERRGREERSVADTSLQQPSLHLPFTGNPIFALLLWPFLSRAKVLLYIYICSSTIPFLSSRLFTTLVPLRSFAILVPAIRLAKQPRISRYSASGDGGRRERNFCSLEEEKPWIVVVKSR